MNILIFGDQTADQYPVLRKASIRRNNALLSTFLEQVSVALRQEVQQLPRTQREQIPDFLRFSDLVEAYYAKGLKIPQLESCMVTVAQLAHYIGYYGENPTELPNPTNGRLLGLCTGLLAASVVASSKTLGEFLPLSIEAIRIAFRTGSCVGNAKEALEQRAGAKESWSTIVAGISENAANSALSKFHEERQIPASAQAYVSAVSVMAITVS
ncbi:hypothetical protein BCR34DRAFT_604322, partial [Clohesyomyces aquaticus]